jgi:hypothetical protein
MAWSHTGAGWIGVDIQDHATSVMMEFCKAVNERLTVSIAVPSYLYLPIEKSIISGKYTGAYSGDIGTYNTDAPDTTTTFSWSRIQAAIDYLAPYFVQSHDIDGTARNINYYDGKTTVDMWTAENLRKAVSANVISTWRGCYGVTPTTWTDYADAAYSVAAGTYGRKALGPWQLVDCQKALNMLKWTTYVPTTKDALIDSVSHEQGFGDIPAWAEDIEYTIGDIVSYGGKYYICINNPNIDILPDSDSGLWTEKTITAGSLAHCRTIVEATFPGGWGACANDGPAQQSSLALSQYVAVASMDRRKARLNTTIISNRLRI